jgi:hypothetical protein
MRRRWWQWPWALPPFHDPSKDDTCRRLMAKRFGG